MSMILTDFQGHLESLSDIIEQNPQYHSVFAAELAYLTEFVALNAKV